MNNVNITSMNTYPAYMNTYPVDYPNYNYPLCVKKIVRTIEKYGPYGEYLGKEIITEEYMEYIYDSQPLPYVQEPYIFVSN